MSERVVVEKLHRHRRRQLFGRFEQPHQQNRSQELVDHPLADFQLTEQRQSIDGVVAQVRGLAAIEIEHGQQKSGDAEAIDNWQALEILERGKRLPQRTGQLNALAKHRGRGLQALR